MAPRVGSLQSQLKAALAERDEALAQLADARALLDLHRLAGRAEQLPHYPRGTEPGQPPLRYVLIDRANDTVKRVLGPLHRAVKRLTGDRK